MGKIKYNLTNKNWINIKHMPYFLCMAYVFCNKKTLSKNVKIFLNSLFELTIMKVDKWISCKSKSTNDWKFTFFV